MTGKNAVLKFPPGVLRNGTKYQTRGRWFDAQLVRFLEGAVRPLGGWEALQEGTTPADITFSAEGALSFLVANVSNGETVTIDTKVYTFQTVLTDVDGNVLIGATTAATITNFIAAITLGAGSGTTYAASTTLHPTATAEVGPSIQSTGTLTLTGQPLDTETVVIDGKTYTYQDTLTDSDGNVLIGATATISRNNLISAINLSSGADGAGTIYALSMTKHTTVAAGVGSTTLKMDAVAKTAGIAGDSLATTETLTNGSWGAATLAGGGNTMFASAKATGLSGATIVTTETLANGSWGSATLIGSVARKLLSWKNNASKATQLLIGTNTKLEHFTQGTVVDRTPAGLTVGGVDSVLAIGPYGAGDYGIQNYGIGDPAQGTFVEAGSWQLDSFGDFPVGVLTSDGRCWIWDTVTNDFTQMPGSPINCDAIVVTPERFVFALGAGGDPRNVQWADQESFSNWTPLATNQAGSFPLSGEGVLMTGKRGKNETLLFTDKDLFAAIYIGGVLIYAFKQVGSACGIISRHAAVVLDGKAIWMGQRGFFQYDGYVRTLNSTVGDFVFGDFNFTQRAKCFAVPQTNFGEVHFYYPSAGSEECDRYVIYNYIENHWNIGQVSRTAGIDRDALEYPMFTDLVNVWQHENGTTHSGATIPYLESGPIEAGVGDRVLDVDFVIPDEATQAGQQLGSLQMFLYTALHPTATETKSAAITLANPTPIRFSARQIRARFEELVAGDWRLGDVRLAGQPGSRR